MGMLDRITGFTGFRRLIQGSGVALETTELGAFHRAAAKTHA